MPLATTATFLDPSELTVGVFHCGAACYGSFNHVSILYRRLRKTAKNDKYLRLVRPSVRLSAWYSLVPTGRIFMKVDV